MSIKISYKKGISEKVIRNYVLFSNEEFKINGLNKLSLSKNSNLINKTIKSNNLDSRNENYYVNSSSRNNYIFNSKISGIEDADLIVLIGTNPRYEATILNSRIRKAYINKNIKVYSLGSVGDITYPYIAIENSTKTIQDIINSKHKLSKIISVSKKPMFIIGQSILKLDPMI